MIATWKNKGGLELSGTVIGRGFFNTNVGESYQVYVEKYPHIDFHVLVENCVVSND